MCVGKADRQSASTSKREGGGRKATLLLSSLEGGSQRGAGHNSAGLEVGSAQLKPK